MYHSIDDQKSTYKQFTYFSIRLLNMPSLIKNLINTSPHVSYFQAQSFSHKGSEGGVKLHVFPWA